MSPFFMKTLFVAVCTAGLYGCSTPVANVRVEQVFADANCQLPQGLSELRSPESLQQALAARRSLSLPATSRPTVPEFDSAARYFLLSLGTKNSGGYGVKLERSEAAIRDQTVWVHIDVQEPEPGMMTSQALTSPCLVFRVDRADYTRLAIAGRDQWALSLEPGGD